MATDFSRRGPQRWGCPAAPALCDALGVRAADGRGSVGLRGGCEASGRAGLVRSAGDSGGPAAGWAPGPAAGALSWRGGPGCGQRLLLLRGLQVRVAAGSVRGERLAGTPSRGLGAWAGSPPSVCSVEHQNLEGHYPRTLRPEKGYPVGEGFSPAPSHQSGQLPPAEPPGCSAAALAPSQTQTAEDSHSLSLSLSLLVSLSKAVALLLYSEEGGRPTFQRETVVGNLGRGRPHWFAGLCARVTHRRWDSGHSRGRLMCVVAALIH